MIVRVIWGRSERAALRQRSQYRSVINDPSRPVLLCKNRPAWPVLQNTATLLITAL
jgi:hypothetical protein